MINGSKKLKYQGLLAAIWVVTALAAIGGVTFAWFSFAPNTNITPMAGAVGNGGIELSISESESGPFAETIDMHPQGTSENMQPVSTNDLSKWYSSVGNSPNGISNKFVDVTEKIDQMIMRGNLYVKCDGGSCNLYFDPEKTSFGNDGQMIASCRLGLRVKSKTDGERLYVLRLDGAGNSLGAESKETMGESNVVVSGVNSIGAPETTSDPSKNIKEYDVTVNGDTYAKGEKSLCSIQDGEVISVEYFLYMEGCDENCINDSKDKNITMQLGFAGVEEQ